MINLLTQATTSGPGSPAIEHTDYGSDGKKTFQAVGSTTSGAGVATINIEVSDDGANWLTHGTIALTLSTTPASAGYEMDAKWTYVRGNITAISGTGAAVSLYMGV